MQHVILARDRKRRKKHLKITVFLLAVASLLVGIFLALKEQPSVNATRQQENTIILDEQINKYEDEVEVTVNNQYNTGFINRITI